MENIGLIFELNKKLARISWQHINNNQRNLNQILKDRSTAVLEIKSPRRIFGMLSFFLNQKE